MTTESNKTAASSEHESKNEGGREFGHVHEPTQAQQASKNMGEADNPPMNRPSHRNQGGIPIRHTYDQGQNQAEDMRRQSQGVRQNQQNESREGERRTA
jgi:hypothetical protein